MYRVRNAQNEDIDIIIEMIEKGRRHIAEYGIDQWQDGYPNRDTVLDDVAKERGFLLMDDGYIIAYFMKEGHDKCYDIIDGAWLDDSPYAVIHRSVTRDFNKGYGTILFDELKKRYPHIRIDTHEGNISMNRCLVKNGFQLCGIITLENGDKRNAYEYSTNL